jgi:arsenate reductase (thioredoxin)
MAEAFFEQTSKKWSAMSAGILPDRKIHPLTIEVMKEFGIDMSKRKPKKLTKRMLEDAYKVIAMDSQVIDQIPIEYHSKIENWRIASLLGRKRMHAERVRDDIRKRVQLLSEELNE